MMKKLKKIIEEDFSKLKKDIKREEMRSIVHKMIAVFEMKEDVYINQIEKEIK